MVPHPVGLRGLIERAGAVSTARGAAGVFLGTSGRPPEADVDHVGRVAKAIAEVSIVSLDGIPEWCWNHPGVFSVLVGCPVLVRLRPGGADTLVRRIRAVRWEKVGGPHVCGPLRVALTLRGPRCGEPDMHVCVEDVLPPRPSAAVALAWLLGPDAHVDGGVSGAVGHPRCSPFAVGTLLLQGAAEIHGPLARAEADRLAQFVHSAVGTIRSSPPWLYGMLACTALARGVPRGCGPWSNPAVAAVAAGTVTSRGERADGACIELVRAVSDWERHSAEGMELDSTDREAAAGPRHQTAVDAVRRAATAERDAAQILAVGRMFAAMPPAELAFVSAAPTAAKDCHGCWTVVWQFPGNATKK